MKRLLATFCLLITNYGFCQEVPVQWTADISKESDSAYIIHLKGTIKKDWYVYAGDENADGITATTISWNNENIIPSGAVENQSIPVIISDKIAKAKLHVYAGELKLQQSITIKGEAPATLRITVSGFSSNGKIFLQFEASKDNISKLLNDCGEHHRNNGLAAIFLLGFAGGLIALFTPCVFPMIPLTISYFSNNKSSSDTNGVAKIVNIDALKSNRYVRTVDRNGLFYGAFIFAIYLFASLPFHLLGNVDTAIFNQISTSVWMNVFFFVVFVTCLRYSKCIF